MASIPREAADLLRDAKVMVHLATCRNGRPHVAPVWFRYRDGPGDDGTDPVVELTTGGRKLRNLRENPYVALSFQKDLDGDTQWMVSARGTAEVVEDDEEFREVNRAINEKYGVGEDEWSGNTLVRVALGSATYRTY